MHAYAQSFLGDKTGAAAVLSRGGLVSVTNATMKTKTSETEDQCQAGNKWTCTLQWSNWTGSKQFAGWGCESQKGLSLGSKWWSQCWGIVFDLAWRNCFNIPTLVDQWEIFAKARLLLMSHGDKQRTSWQSIFVLLCLMDRQHTLKEGLHVWQTSCPCETATVFNSWPLRSHSAQAS